MIDEEANSKVAKGINALGAAWAKKLSSIGSSA